MIHAPDQLIACGSSRIVINHRTLGRETEQETALPAAADVAESLQPSPKGCTQSARNLRVSTPTFPKSQHLQGTASDEHQVCLSSP